MIPILIAGTLGGFAAGTLFGVSLMCVCSALSSGEDKPKNENFEAREIIK